MDFFIIPSIGSDLLAMAKIPHLLPTGKAVHSVIQSFRLQPDVSDLRWIGR